MCYNSRQAARRIKGIGRGIQSWKQETWYYDGDRETQESKVSRRERDQKKGCLKTRSFSHYWLNQRERNAENLRARDLGKGKGPYS